MKLKAKKKFFSGGTLYTPGDELEAEDTRAAELIQAGQAVRVASTGSGSGRIQTADMQAEDTPKPYARRDMRAEK